MSPWSNPENAEVARTLSMVGEPSLRRLFFQELENPEWLLPLTELGVFADPGIVETDDGYRAWPWPEGDYLLRIAPDRPVEVAQLAIGLIGSRNPWVQRTLIEIAAALPVEHVVQLVPGLTDLLEGKPDRVDQLKVAILIERLLESGKRKEARRLLTALFRPTAGDEETMAFGSRRRISSSLDDYWYRELLERLAPGLVGLGLKGLKLLASWLIDATEIRSEGRADDVYSIWRPSIGSHEQNSGLYEIDDALIDAVRDVGIAVTRALDTREPIDFLNSRPQFLLRRIGVEVAAAVLDDDHGRSLIDVGNEMLLDQSLLEIDVRPEYAHLARVLVPQFRELRLEQWSQFILGGGWLPSAEQLRRLAAWPDGDIGAVTSEEVNQERLRLTHRLLSSFSPVLTGGLAQEFAQLEAQFGQIHHPEFHSYMESFRGPTSPLSAADLATMTTADIASALLNWSPEPGHLLGPSVDGLARVLENVVVTGPARFEELRSQLIDLKPAYVRAIVAGWAQAVKGGFRPTGPVWRTLFELATHDRNEQVPDESVFLEDDPRWQMVHRALVDLANAVVDVENGIDQLEAAGDLLKLLMDHFDPTPDSEERYGGSNMDPLTLSLNTVRPAALRAGIRLLAVLSEDESQLAVALQSDLLERLSLHASHSLDPSLAVAAVFGEGIGRIWNVDESWVERHIEDLMLAITSPDSARRAWTDVVVSVALRMYQQGAAVVNMMRPAFEAIFSQQYARQDHTEGWREHRSTVQSAASHLIWTIAQGAIHLEDPLVTAMFGGVVASDQLSEALGHLGWQLMQLFGKEDQPSPPADFLGRAQALIESRMEAARGGSGQFAEMSHFYWWIKSGAFEIEWWLPILAEITEAGVSLDKTFIGESLEQAMVHDPVTAITVFERLVGMTDYWQRYDLLQHAAKILAGGLVSGAPEAVERARSLMDVLAREGNLDVIDQIERLTRPAEP